jgi:cytochrome c oxidase subunit 2
MDKKEKTWFVILILIAVTFNVVSLTPLIPWQEWRIWSHPTPDKSFTLVFDDYQIQLPADGIQVKTGEYVEFVATSNDVTYGLGVLRPDGQIVFSVQVVPGHTNKIIWRFDTPGEYDIRNTEYSGPRHPEMLVKSAIKVGM